MTDLPRYCRDVESYLCQKNAGHLIRIVGPAFERVCSWAERGVPLKIAFRGIDRCCERYNAKSGRRRPVRIEFCEADILDAFDDWRRAVGVAAAGDAGTGIAAGRKPALAAHIERALGKLRSTSPPGVRSAKLVTRMDLVAGELETLVDDARTARGERRVRIVARLLALDRELVTTAVEETDSVRAAGLRQEAEAELAPFGDRMASGAREKAVLAAFERLVRESLGLPTLTYE